VTPAAAGRPADAQADRILWETPITPARSWFLNSNKPALRQLVIDTVGADQAYTLALAPARVTKKAPRRAILRLSLATPTQPRPPPAVVQSMVDAVLRFLQEQVRESECFTVPGISHKEFLDDAEIKQLARANRISMYVQSPPSASSSILGPGDGTGDAQPSQHRAAAVGSTGPQMLCITVPSDWTDDDVRQYCWNQHRLHSYKAEPRGLSAAGGAPGATAGPSQLWRLKLVNKSHPTSRRAALYADLSARPPVHHRGIDVRFHVIRAAAVGPHASTPATANSVPTAAPTTMMVKVTLLTLASDDVDARLNMIRDKCMALARQTVQTGTLLPRLRAAEHRVETTVVTDRHDNNAATAGPTGPLAEQDAGVGRANMGVNAGAAGLVALVNGRAGPARERRGRQCVCV
jgi:hypothetical protein